ncbi:OprO/OprP family phosphate-selective porin [Alphaproteobacteria bacterium]|nr:OprO/OprP family phosphate-selective porin [Alphaproteobacteria bacterium]
MNLINKIVTGLTLVLFTLSLTNLSRADAHSDRLDRIESQVQDALIKMKGLEKKTKDMPSIKSGPGLKIKKGKNEVKVGGRIHFDVGLHDPDPVLTCEVASVEGGSCFTDGTNFRRLRLGVSGKYDNSYYYKVQYDAGASAKQQNITSSDSDAHNDIFSVDEAFLGYKLGKNTTVSIGKQKIPVSFAESTSSNDLTFIERAPSVDIMTDHSIGPKRMSAQLRNWDKKMGYLIEAAVHGSGDVTPTESFDEQFGLTGRVVYAPIHQKKHVLHMGYWRDQTDTDGPMGDTSMEWDYRIGLNVSDEKPVDADIGSDLGDVQSMTHWGVEFAYLYKNYWFATEWLWGEMERSVNSAIAPSCTSVEANMGYWELGYTIGGERRYTIKKGGWKRPKVKNPVNKGGMGVIELGFRHNRSSLNDICTGYGSQGAMYSNTFGLNWQLNNSNRIMFNYLMVDLDAEAVDEITSLSPGSTALGITNTEGAMSEVRAIGIRFQTNF